MIRVVLVLALLFTLSTAAEAGPLGLGIIAGEPTGLSAKRSLDDQKAVDLAIGWSLKKEGRLHLHSDILFRVHQFAMAAGDSAHLYYGAGARLRLEEDDDSRLGMRIPVGVSYTFRGQPLEVFLEFAALMDLVPETDLDLGGGVGLRFYFNSRRPPP